jgi:tetratricopeptide (TPR) repeat protein
MSRKPNKSARKASVPRASIEPAPPKSTWRSPWVELGLAGLILIVYAQVRHFQFVNWDDPTYVTENTTVLGGLSWSSAWWALTTDHPPYWHPITWLSHLLDVTLFGVDAGSHHVMSLALHVLNTWALFWLLRRMTGSSGRSLAVAAIFAVHPLHVESVAWIAERKDVLSTSFLFVGFWAYIRYVARPSWLRYCGVGLAFALALMAKPMVVTFPLLLLLLDYWPLGRVRMAAAGTGSTWSQLVLEKVPLVLMGIAASVITILRQAHVGALATLDTLSPIGRIERAGISYVHYVGAAIWPARLAAFYPPEPGEPAAVAIAVIGLVLVSGVVYSARRFRYLLVGWCWFLVGLAPVIGVLQAGEQARADRFMYVPLVGLLIVAVWGGSELARAWRIPAPVPAVAAALVVFALTAAARIQAATWSDSVSLWQHAIAATSGNYKAYENLAQAKRALGRLEEARLDYQSALALAPSDSPHYSAVLHDDVGLVLALEQRTSEAAEEFATAVRQDPSLAEAQLNLADAMAKQGRLSEAFDHFSAAIRLEPRLAEAYVGLGNLLLGQSRLSEAQQRFSDALGINPDLADARNGLGAVLTETGHSDQAIAELTEALRLRPRFPSAEVNLAIVLLKSGRVDEARRHAEAALALDPTLASARQLLAGLGKG